MVSYQFLSFSSKDRLDELKWPMKVPIFDTIKIKMIYDFKNVTCLMSWLTCMSQLSWSFTRSWSWDLLIDLICMQKENFPSDFASSCAHGTLTICRSYRNQKTHTYCKVSSSLSGCKDVDTFEFMKPPQTLWLQNYWLWVS